jgi:hypothetical protein
MRPPTDDCDNVSTCAHQRRREWRHRKRGATEDARAATTSAAAMPARWLKQPGDPAREKSTASPSLPTPNGIGGNNRRGRAALAPQHGDERPSGIGCLGPIKKCRRTPQGWHWAAIHFVKTGALIYSNSVIGDRQRDGFRSALPADLFSTLRQPGPSAPPPPSPLEKGGVAAQEEGRPDAPVGVEPASPFPVPTADRPSPWSGTVSRSSAHRPEPAVALLSLVFNLMWLWNVTPPPTKNVTRWRNQPT